jgi:holin-like protein
VPGSVVGLFLLFILLMTGGINLLTVRRGAQWYLAEMLLFFIPAVLAVLDHHEFFGLLGLKILAVILLGTVIVMISTALAVEAGLRLSRHLHKMRHSS